MLKNLSTLTYVNTFKTLRACIIIVPANKWKKCKVLKTIIVSESEFYLFPRSAIEIFQITILMQN